ncbi:uncharacterized protein METZ01_LOCUS496528, partial [marine metagenome]|tara:strand:- start:390 stop:518 length:129 start_codon:yes stop_codon:yes gene_type:complete
VQPIAVEAIKSTSAATKLQLEPLPLGEGLNSGALLGLSGLAA